jgi:hypothetical protein
MLSLEAATETLLIGFRMCYVRGCRSLAFEFFLACRNREAGRNSVILVNVGDSKYPGRR